MTTIGSLTIDLIAEIGSFRRDLQRANSDLQSVSQSMRRQLQAVERSTREVANSFRSIQTAVAGLAGVLAVRQFGQFAKAALDSAGAIADAAASVGLSTKALQEYQVAAGLAGVGVERFDAALQRFVRNLGEARQGSGTLVSAFKDTDGAFLRQLQSAASTEKALDLVFRKLGSIPDAAGRAAAAADLFGREGVKMTTMLDEGVAGLERFRRKATEVGGVLGEDLVRQADRIGNSIDLITRVFGVGFQRGLIRDISASIGGIEASLKAASVAGQNFGRIVGGVMREVVSVAEFAGKNMKEIGAIVAGVGVAAASALGAGLAASILSYADAVRKAAAAHGLLAAALAVNPLSVIPVVVGAATAALIYFRDETITIGETTIRVGNVVHATWVTIRETIEATVLSVIRSIEGLARLLLLNVSGALEKFNLSGQTIRDSASEVAAAWSNLAPAVDAGRVAIDDATSATETLAAAFKPVKSAAEEAAEAIAKSAASFALQAEQSRQLIAALKRGGDAYKNLSNDIEIETEWAQLWAKVAADGVKVTNEQKSAWETAARSAQKYKQELDSLLDAEEERKKALEKALEEQKRLADRQRELMLEPFKNALEGIQDAFADAFEGVFSGTIDTFKELASSIKRIMVRTAAEIAALLVFRPVVGSALGALGMNELATAMGLGRSTAAGGSSALGIGNVAGIGNLLSGGGSGSLLGGLGNWISTSSLGQALGLSTSVSSSTLASAGVPMGWATAPIQTGAGNALSAGLAASPWGIVGSLGANVMGLGHSNPWVNAASGTLGSVAGGAAGAAALGATLGAAAGPVGAVLGAFAGTALGGLLGGKPSVGPVLAGSFGPGGVRGVQTDNGGARDAAQQFVASVQSFTQAVASFGSGRITGSVGFEQSEREGYWIYGMAKKFGSDLGGFLREVVQRTVSGLDQQIAGVLKRSKATTAEGILSDIEFAKSVFDLSKMVSPLDQSLKAINDNFATMISRARDLNLSTDALVAARDREIAAVNLQARAPYLEAAGGIVDFLKAQSLSAESSLSPSGRLMEAQRQFGDLLARVREGEVGLTGSLTGAASTLLGAGRENFASSLDFANIENFVRSSLVTVGETLTSDEFFDAQVEATRQQTSVLSGDLAEVKDAIGRLERELRMQRQAS